MKSPITKLAAVIVVIIAVILGLNIIGGPDMAAGVAWGEVIRKAEVISSLMAEATIEITFPGNKKLFTKEDIYVAGDYGTRSDIYMNGELFIIKYRLPNKKVAYQIHPKEKRYVRFDLSGEQAAIGRNPDDPRQWLRKILSGDYVELGSGNINGIDVEGIEAIDPEITGESMAMRLWVDIETDLPVRVEIEGEDFEGGKMRPQKIIIDDFQWDVELDPALFEPNIPDDYTEIQPQTQIRQQKEPKMKEASKKLSDDEKREQIVVKEVARELLQACANKNWEEFSDLWPGLSLNKMQKIYLGGLEIIHIGEPFKTDDSAMWYVPYQIKLKLGGVRKRNLRVRYDETTDRFIACGGL